MGMIIEQKIDKPEKVKSDIPISDEAKLNVKKHTAEIKDIISRSDNRKIVIIGPCSAWPSEAVLEYAEKLSGISEQISDKIKVVLRSYTQKPRTTVGWTGPMNFPNPFGREDIQNGIRYCRKMMSQIAEKYELPLADEALFTHNGGYFDDLLSWVAIGARSSEDQEHRLHASGLDVATGMKNPTSGNLEVAINSLISAQAPHRFKYNEFQVVTDGNPYAHLILRGGDMGPNYSEDNITKLIDLMRTKNIVNPSIVIDVSHANSGKDHLKQPRILDEILGYDNKSLEYVKGFMIESFLVDGKQDHTKMQSKDQLTDGMSITDGCLGWEKTERMLSVMYDRL